MRAWATSLAPMALTSTIFGTFKLEFYPADFGKSRAQNGGYRVAPLPDNGNGSVQLSNSNPELTQAFTLPKNVESAYLDVVTLQSQNEEEQWFPLLAEQCCERRGRLR